MRRLSCFLFPRQRSGLSVNEDDLRRTAAERFGTRYASLVQILHLSWAIFQVKDFNTIEFVPSPLGSGRGVNYEGLYNLAWITIASVRQLLSVSTGFEGCNSV